LSAVRSFGAAKVFAAAAGLRGVEPRFRVLDSIHETGAKLVEMTADVAADLKANQPGLRIVPVVVYKPLRPVYQVESKLAAAATAPRLVVTVWSRAGNTPVRGATVVAFTDFANRVGAQGTTAANGQVRLNLGRAKKVERLYVFGPAGFWGALKKNVTTADEVKVALVPVDLAFTDCVRHFYGPGSPEDGAGVTVGVVDTGVGPHPDLVVAGGENTVLGEDPNDFGDNGEGHGSHVGGIVAARGTPPEGIRGIASGATLRSYRVFGKGADGATNFAIAKAINRAVADGCDLVNLSLGGGDPDPATASAIHDARQAGTLVLAAAGNDDRGPVSFPAADPLCLAVSALGVVGTFPKDSTEGGDVMGPAGTDRAEFVAAFSNVGPEVDLIGPGVGVLSTVPGGYAPMSGTSMACPAVTGFAARLLAGLPEVLGMPRDQERSDEMARRVMFSAKSRGFPAEMEGRGLPVQ
jgi:subtilisin